MTQPEVLDGVPTFFAEGAFAETRIGYSGIHYDLELMGQASDFMKNEIGRGLPDSPDNVAYVYRFGEPGYQRPEPDPNYFKTNPATRYVAAGQLLLGPEITASTVTKADIRALDKPVLQVQLKDGMPPTMNALAESVLYPAAEDHRMAASLLAWGRQFKEAFNPKEAVGNKRRIMEEVTARYSGAIILQPRRRGRHAATE